MPGKRTAFLGAAARGLIVKVCCIASIDEAEMAIDAGADALGLVSAMPSGPGVIEDADIARIVEWVDSRAATVLLTSRLTADGVDDQLRHAHPAVLQLVDAVPDAEIAAMRTRHPDILVMPVVHVRSEDSIGEAVRTVRPAGVDVCSGVRRDGRLHRGLLAAFVTAARDAF